MNVFLVPCAVPWCERTKMKFKKMIDGIHQTELPFQFSWNMRWPFFSRSFLRRCRSRCRAISNFPLTLQLQFRQLPLAYFVSKVSDLLHYSCAESRSLHNIKLSSRGVFLFILIKYNFDLKEKNSKTSKTLVGDEGKCDQKNRRSPNRPYNVQRIICNSCVRSFLFLFFFALMHRSTIVPCQANGREKESERREWKKDCCARNVSTCARGKRIKFLLQDQ